MLAGPQVVLGRACSWPGLPAVGEEPRRIARYQKSREHDSYTEHLSRMALGLAVQFPFVSLRLRLQFGIVLFLHDTAATQQQRRQANECKYHVFGLHKCLHSIPVFDSAFVPGLATGTETFGLQRPHYGVRIGQEGGSASDQCGRIRKPVFRLRDYAVNVEVINNTQAGVTRTLTLRDRSVNESSARTIDFTFLAGIAFCGAQCAANQKCVYQKSSD